MEPPTKDTKKDMHPFHDLLRFNASLDMYHRILKEQLADLEPGVI